MNRVTGAISIVTSIYRFLRISSATTIRMDQGEIDVVLLPVRDGEGPILLENASIFSSFMHLQDQSGASYARCQVGSQQTHHDPVVIVCQGNGVPHNHYSIAHRHRTPLISS